MTDRELLQQALDALISVWNMDKTTKQVETIQAIKVRLAQPEPKPVGCITEVHTKTAYGGTAAVVPQMYRFLPVGTLLYTAPPKKEWVGLTDGDVNYCVDAIYKGFDIKPRNEIEIEYFERVIKFVEAKLKEKNT